MRGRKEVSKKLNMRFIKSMIFFEKEKDMVIRESEDSRMSGMSLSSRGVRRSRSTRDNFRSDEVNL